MCLPGSPNIAKGERAGNINISAFPDHGVLYRKTKMPKVGDSYKELAIRLEVLSPGHGFVVILSTFSDRGKGTQVYKV